MTDIEYEESKEHFESLKEVPSCKICQKTFSSIYVYRNHIISVHGENFSGEFKCEICDGSFASDHHLIKHRHVLHPLQYPPPESPVVGKKDFRDFCENPDLPVECVPCKKPCRNFERFYRHHRAAHTEDKFEKENLSFRILTVEEYEDFANQSKRRESIYKAYTENPDLPHECLICKKPFSSFKCFKLHFGKMHKNDDIQISFRIVWN